MSLSELIRNAEVQGELLSKYCRTDPDGQISLLAKLNTICAENLAISEEITKKHQSFLDQSCRPILDKAQTVLDKLLEGQLHVGLAVRKSYEAIYVSQTARESDSSSQRFRKNKQHDRALEIQKLGCDGAMVLAGALSTSEWAHLVAALKFEYLLKKIPKPPPECLPALLKTLEAWGNETPLVDCATFKDSLTALRARSNEEAVVSVPYLPTPASIRHIQYAFSNVPFEKISSINDNLPDAIMRSRTVEMEKQRGQRSSSCVTIFVPDDMQKDGSVNIVIERSAGFIMQRNLALESVTLS